MKTTLGRIAISAPLIIIAVILTGCPASRDGNQTGAGNPPARLSSSDSNQTGAGHRPSLSDSTRINDTTKRF